MRKRLGIVASVAALLVGAVLSQAKTDKTSTQSTGAASFDMSGNWVLDPSKSDAPPPRGGGAGRWGGGRPEGSGPPHGDGGHSGGTHAEGGRTPGGPGGSGRPARLPASFHATQTATLVSFEDSTGAVVQEIATVSATADTMTHAPGAAHWVGVWKDAKLVVTHEGPRGTITETWSLEDKGASLISVVRIKGGDMDRTFKRVYRRGSVGQ